MLKLIQRLPPAVEVILVIGVAFGRSIYTSIEGLLDSDSYNTSQQAVPLDDSVLVGLMEYEIINLVAEQVLCHR